jgi:hypothetical protein
MIRFQVVEHYGAGLYRELLALMRSGALQTFSASKRGRKLSHVKYPGWINWTNSEGTITCEVLSPRRPNEEWQLMHAFLGRLAARFAASIIAINIQFPISPEEIKAASSAKKRNARIPRRRLSKK